MRSFDVVVLGATGVTGGNALPYLAERATESGLRWAIAGRSPQKLHQRAAQLPVAGAPEVLEADLDDPASLLEVARAARVVVNCIGPYRRSAGPVIEACISAGAHYLDVTGEMDVVRHQLITTSAAAAEAGVKVIQAAGFEALPFDLATALAVTIAARRGAVLRGVEVVASVALPPGLPRPSDGVSGGTFVSTVAALREGALDQLTDPAVLLADPAEAARVRKASPYGTLPRLTGTTLVVPMIPTPFANPPVIHRTLSVLRAEGGGATDDFRYREGVAMADGLLSIPVGLLLGGPLSIAVTGARLLAKVVPLPVRRGVAAVMEQVGPDAGSGPAEDRLEGWRWRLTLLATGDDGEVDRVVVDADGHPGYLATSRMLAEAAIVLADDDANVPDRVGHLTPALALGTDELRRFARAGVRFTAG